METDEYDEIHALRAVEFVAHERQEWGLAVVAAAVANSMGRDPPLEPSEVLKVIQLYEEQPETVTPAQAAAMARGKRGDVRGSRSPAGT